MTCGCSTTTTLNAGVYCSGIIYCPKHAAVDELIEACGKVLAGFDDGTWGRNTENDDDPMWAIKLLPRLRELAEAQGILARLRNQGSAESE